MEHNFCGHCGARMTHRSYLEVDYEDAQPVFDRETGAKQRDKEHRVDVWACPNADLDDYQLCGELEDHDVEKT